MKLQTRLFGTIEYEEDRTILFPDGLPGFEDAHSFLMIDDDAVQPFRWLQCVDRADLAFAVINPLLFCPDYQVPLARERAAAIDYEEGDDVLVLTIAVLAQDPEDITTNLRGPLLINSKSMKGLQVVIESEIYGTKVRILGDLEAASMEIEESGFEAAESELASRARHALQLT